MFATTAKAVACLGTALSFVITVSSPLSALTIDEALALAYNNNPTLNAARAQLRSVDEAVPQALAGWRPRIFGTADVTGVYGKQRGFKSTTNTSYSIGLDVEQPIFRGFRTVNSVRQAEALIASERQSLRSTEQQVLFQAAQAYTDVLQDAALVSLARSNVNFLAEQVRAARDRFEVGEGTRTDTAQAEARLAGAESDLNFSLANLNSSRAIFEQVIGVMPGRLTPSTRVERLLPGSIEAAIPIGDRAHPAIQSARFLVDAAVFNVKTLEGELLPSITLQGQIERTFNPQSQFGIDPAFEDSAALIGRLSVPIYQGGQEYSRVRQGKEELGQTEIEVQVARDQIRANLIRAWAEYRASVASIQAAETEVAAQQLALDGVLEEQRVGQRTTLDVLDSQRDLIDAQVNLVTAQRDRIVSAYGLLAALGKLDAESLGLNVTIYRPNEHYETVRNKWIGLTTPDGR